MGPYRSSVFIRPYGFKCDLMGPYMSLYVCMCPYGFLWFFMRLYGI